MVAEVVTLHERNAADIASMLRECADSIEKGPSPRSVIAIMTETDGSLGVYGWGQTDAVDTLATLQLAVVKHANSML